MEFLAKWISALAFLIHLTAGLETKMFQLTMPNVRPYRVSSRVENELRWLPYACETTSCNPNELPSLNLLINHALIFARGFLKRKARQSPIRSFHPSPRFPDD